MFPKTFFDARFLSGMVSMCAAFYALMDPVGVVASASILSEGGSFPLPPPEGIFSSEESNVDGASGVVSEDHHAYLEGKWESFLSPRLSTIL